MAFEASDEEDSAEHHCPEHCRDGIVKDEVSRLCTGWTGLLRVCVWRLL